MIEHISEVMIRILSKIDEDISMGNAAVRLPIPDHECHAADQIAAAKEIWAKNGKGIDFIKSSTYELMIDENLVDITPDEIKAYMSRARAAMRKKRRYNSELFANMDRSHWQREYAKKLVVNDYFTKEIDKTNTTHE